MQILTVSEITSYLKTLLQADDVLRDVWVEGEVSGLTRSSAGHCYFTIKDQGAQLAAVCFRRDAERLKAIPRNGDQVYAHGQVTFYDGGGKLQVVVDDIRAAGAGLLNARFEELKARLEREGLFDSGRKRPLPAYPQRIGVATSPTGAALRDVLNVLGRRYPLAEVLLSPCLVQGETAPESIVRALRRLYATGVDVIILARGGGSAEDLDSFNNELVARAVYASPVPLITGVGHETDTTIVDYVSDLRAPTPSAAAELVAPDRDELLVALAGLRSSLETVLAERLDERRSDIDYLAQRLRQRSPSLRLSRDRQQVDDIVRRMGNRLVHSAQLRRAQLGGLLAQLQTLSPLATLERGYAVVRRANGVVVVAPDQVDPGERLLITVRDGTIEAQVEG